MTFPLALPEARWGESFLEGLALYQESLKEQNPSVSCQSPALACSNTGLSQWCCIQLQADSSAGSVALGSRMCWRGTWWDCAKEFWEERRQGGMTRLNVPGQGVS